MYYSVVIVRSSAGFTYRLDRLKPRASKFKGPPVKVYNIFNTVIGLSHLSFHKNPLVVFLTELHSISEYCSILNSPRHQPLLKLIKQTCMFLQS